MAVLPLKNLSGDSSQDYYADGLTEALITELGKIARFRVMSFQSAAGTQDGEADCRKSRASCRPTYCWKARGALGRARAHHDQAFSRRCRSASAVRELRIRLRGTSLPYRRPWRETWLAER